MLISRLQYNMNRVLEGVDTCNSQLILEASKEFTSATDELKKNIAAFVDICKSFDEISSFVSPLEASLQNINKIKMDEISDEYSFTDHYKMQSAEMRNENDVNPEYLVSTVALEYPTYVNALRDAILEVASWFEEHKAVFSVGKNGIFLTELMQSFVGQNVEIKVSTFCDEEGEQILKNVSGLTEIDEMKAHFSKGWKTEDVSPEKEDDAWSAFVDNIGKIGQGAQAAHDAASNAIKGIKPPEQVQGAGNNAGGILKSVIGSIFSKKDDEIIEPISQEPEWIIGSSKDDDSKGIFAMSFEDLQLLISKIIEFASSADNAGAKAIAGLDAHQKEVMKPSKEQEDLLNQNKEIVKDMDTSIALGAAAEASGYENKIDQIDSSEFEERVSKIFDNDEEKTEYYMKEIGLEVAEKEEDSLPAGLEEKETEIETFGKSLKDALEVEIQDESDIDKLEQKAEELYAKEEEIFQEVEDEKVKEFRQWFESTTKKMGMINDTMAFGYSQITDLTWDWGIPKDEYTDGGLWKEIHDLDWHKDFREIDREIEKQRFGVMDGTTDPEDARKALEPLLKDYMKYKDKLLSWYKNKNAPKENLVRRWSLIAGIIKG